MILQSFSSKHAFSFYSLAYPNPLLHQVCYAAIMITSVFLVYGNYNSPALSPAMVRQAKDLNVSGAIIFLAGFTIWNIGICDSKVIINFNITDDTPSVQTTSIATTFQAGG